MKVKIRLKSTSASDFGLSGRIKLAIDDKRTLYIIKNIKSRIIMKDGLKILEIAKKIKRKVQTNVSLATTAPICSKTKAYLNKNKIEIIFDYILY